MPAVRGLTVAVGDWYASTLAVTLVRNMRHMTECVVVTSPEDEAVRAVVEGVPGSRLLVTTAMREHGARFNKGLCLELGADALGRDGLILIHDADILFPDHLPLERLRPTAIHGARRRILPDPGQWHPGYDWSQAKKHIDGSPIGFFQLFRADAPALAGKAQWHDVSFPHAGGCDAYLLNHFSGGDRVMLPMDVLHLGPVDTHWFGCDQEGKDLMARYVTENRWQRAMKNHTPESAARAGDLPGRISVPGYPDSDFELPFERRAAAIREREARSHRTP